MNQDNLQPLKGFRDFLPEQAQTRQEVLNRIRSVFARYGFLPLETPALEYKEILRGKYGEEGDKLMYGFRDQGGREVAMRYDLTVPLSRVVAAYQNDLVIPFKRYQIAPVWRADRPQKGRLREFTQCDVDVVGTASLVADAEVIACLNAAFLELGIKEVVIRLNNRKLLDGLMREAGVPAPNTPAAIRVLDKLEKIGETEARTQLAGLGIQSKAVGRLFELLGEGLEDPEDIIKKFEGFAGAGELAEIVETLLDMQIKNYEVDLTLARGLDYYTGTIFELTLPDASGFGAVAGGGRYDNLIGKFSGKTIPAVGGSIGVDRLVEALEEMELVSPSAGADVLVCNLEEGLEETYLRLTAQLRQAGIKTDFYYEPVKLDKQLKYADKKKIRYAVIIGPDEQKQDQAALKNLATGKQEIVTQKDLSKKLKV